MDADQAAFVALLRRDYADLFDAARPVRLACVPGRLDAFGGIIDYTGGTVCETPIAATLRLAFQRRDDRRLVLRSHAADDHGLDVATEVDLDSLSAGGRPLPYDEARTVLPGWTGYVAGAWPVLVGEGVATSIDHGATVVIDSAVPVGGGLSSSAAIEMATLGALTADLGLNVPPKRLARLGQVVENQVVGAPCGLMDQLTVTLGRADSLLVIRCQPDEILATPHLPDGVRLTAIESGVKHSIAGREYTAARCAAFMGHRILTDGLAADPFGGLLARLSPEAYQPLRARLPETMPGDEFLNRYGGTVDPVTVVDPAQVYSVRAAVDHHVLDNRRSLEFLLALEAYRYTTDTAHLHRAGELMRASHAGYGNIGLGAAECDLLVDLVAEAGLFGARITGGGCGGAVAILSDEAGVERLPELVAEYERRAGATACIHAGSSDGLVAAGTHEIRL